jgi:hypothetical protein
MHLLGSTLLQTYRWKPHLSSSSRELFGVTRFGRPTVQNTGEELTACYPKMLTEFERG